MPDGGCSPDIRRSVARWRRGSNVCPQGSPRRHGEHGWQDDQTELLFNLDICRLNQTPPFHDIGLDAGGDLVWRADDRVEAQRLELLPHVRLPNDVADLTIQQFN